MANVICKLSLLIIFLKYSLAIDTLLPNQSISVEQSLVCQSQTFELAFFRPGTSNNMFLGVRYKATPDVVVWVANRNNPINESRGVVFVISGNGSLAISREGSIIWSDISAGVVSSPVLRLLDTGNVVVVEETTGGYIWQSFDHITDTLLPGMKIIDDPDAGVETNLTSWRNSSDPSTGDFVFKIRNLGLPELVIYKGENISYRSGQWNGAQFSSMPSFPNSIFEPDLNFSNGRLISISGVYNVSIFTRSMIDPSGFIQRSTMNSRKDMWNPAYICPVDRCDRYGYCGPYAICRIEQVQTCECFKGFTPKSQTDWDLQDWQDGCTRNTPLNCHGGDGFIEVRGVKYPDMIEFWLNTSMSLQECKDECLENCSCTAYANINVTGGGSGCLMWLGDLIDIRTIPAAYANQNLYIRLPISELGATTNSDKNEEEMKSKRRRSKLIVIFVTTAVSFASIIAGLTLLIMTRRKRPAPMVESEDIELPLFNFGTIVAATKDFSVENLIGEGGFGRVYKGKLSNEEEIAVKRLSRTSKQGLKEFKNEVILIAKLQHRNLVKLLGCCIEGEERMLIYEYLHNKSLNCFLFDQKRTLLTWPKRFDIIMGIAKGLLYLHHDSRLKIIHRDLKTSNILLDGDLNPKISDFGLARIFGEGESIGTTKRVVGTYGYMAPEYAVDGNYSVKSDIFAFGVILLEIVSGKKNRGFDHSDHYHSLLGHAWLLWKEKNIMELMDDCLSNTFIESQVKRCIQVGLLCVQKFAGDRPVMSSVIFMLGTDGAILPKPKEPGFFIERHTSCTTNSCQETFTITELEPR